MSLFDDIPDEDEAPTASAAPSKSLFDDIPDEDGSPGVQLARKPAVKASDLPRRPGSLPARPDVGDGRVTLSSSPVRRNENAGVEALKGFGRALPAAVAEAAVGEPGRHVAGIVGKVGEGDLAGAAADTLPLAALPFAPARAMLGGKAYIDALSRANPRTGADAAKTFLDLASAGGMAASGAEAAPAAPGPGISQSSVARGVQALGSGAAKYVTEGGIPGINARGAASEALGAIKRSWENSGLKAAATEPPAWAAEARSPRALAQERVRASTPNEFDAMLREQARGGVARDGVAPAQDRVPAAPEPVRGGLPPEAPPDALVDGSFAREANAEIDRAQLMRDTVAAEREMLRRMAISNQRPPIEPQPARGGLPPEPNMPVDTRAMNAELEASLRDRAARLAEADAVTQAAQSRPEPAIQPEPVRGGLPPEASDAGGFDIARANAELEALAQVKRDLAAQSPELPPVPDDPRVLRPFGSKERGGPGPRSHLAAAYAEEARMTGRHPHSVEAMERGRAGKVYGNPPADAPVQNVAAGELEKYLPRKPDGSPDYSSIFIGSGPRRGRSR